MGHVVQCRWCKQQFDRDLTDNWIMPSKNWYYHKECYDEKQNGKLNFYQDTDEKSDDVWLDAICQFLEKDLKIAIQYNIMRPAWDSLLKKGYKAKGVYFATIYAYQIKHMDPEKSPTRLGLIPFVYKEANEYFIEQSKKNKNLYTELMKQMQERAQRPSKKINHNRKKVQQPRFDLNDIGGEDEL